MSNNEVVNMNLDSPDYIQDDSSNPYRSTTPEAGAGDGATVDKERATVVYQEEEEKKQEVINTGNNPISSAMNGSNSHFSMMQSV
jgi:hypothetical protein